MIENSQGYANASLFYYRYKILSAKAGNGGFKMKRRKVKKLEELVIWDDFMFGAVMRNKELCKTMLELILNEKIRDIQYPELQKTIDRQYNAKSVRLDVYVEDDKNTVYNIEIQVAESKNLAKRFRYYQDMIDLNAIDKGDDYNDLKKSFVIFICNYDPFGKDRCLYRFENLCVDDASLRLGDDCVKIVINPFGSNASEKGNDFKAFMEYLKGGEVTNNYTRSLEKEVRAVRSSEEWRREYMTLFMRDKENREIGKEIGDLARGVRLIRNNIDKYPVNALAELFEYDVETVEKIIEYIKAFPELSNEDIAIELLDENSDED